MKEYIEKGALIDALMMYAWHEDDREIDDSDERRKFIEEWFPNIPAADVREVRRGKWEEHCSDGKFRGHCVCSACGRMVLTDPDIARFYNFCPNCGADMRSKEDADHV